MSAFQPPPLPPFFLSLSLPRIAVQNITKLQRKIVPLIIYLYSIENYKKSWILTIKCLNSPQPLPPSLSPSYNPCILGYKICYFFQ